MVERMFYLGDGQMKHRHNPMSHSVWKGWNRTWNHHQMLGRAFFESEQGLFLFYFSQRQYFSVLFSIVLSTLEKHPFHDIISMWSEQWWYVHVHVVAGPLKGSLTVRYVGLIRLTLASAMVNVILKIQLCAFSCTSNSMELHSQVYVLKVLF